MAEKLEKGQLSIHTENIFPIIKKWLYSEHDIFLRELVSNAVDAMNKRKLEDESLEINDDYKLEVVLDKKKKTIQVIDKGIGMTEEEIEKYINQIAFSGAEDFIEKYKDKQSNIIGHFGLGFYSSFMVAEKVTIDSLSWQKDAKPAYWECDGSTNYSVGEGSRTKVGTTITIYVNKDNKHYLEEDKIKEILKKYCNFMPFPIQFGEEIVNQMEAIWNRKPKDVTEEEYKEFYKQFFGEWTDPLFWIHLNVDYPHRVKGILYFPQVKNEFDVNKGQVKLFCNNVFVADNLKDLLPEFLLLLKGGIDIPDIPLNVSRSFLQNDQMVQKISQYIVKKVGDHFKKTFTKERDKYEGYWDDISNFIKYGLLTNDKFYDALKDQIIYKTMNDDHVTIEEYLNRYRSEEKPHKIYYTNSKDTQVTYQKLLKDQGIEVIIADSVIDSHLFQQIEMKNTEVRFVRVDSELNDTLVDDAQDDEVDENGIAFSDKIKEIFNKALNSNIEASFGKEPFEELIKKYPQATEILSKYSRTEGDQTLIRPYNIPVKARKEMGNDAFNEIFSHIYTDTKVEVKNLKSEDIPAMVMFEEFMRRFQEMNAMMSHGDADMLKMHTIAVNKNNSTVKKVVKFYDEGKYDEAKLLVNFVHELALLEQKRFSGAELQSFVTKANDILKLL